MAAPIPSAPGPRALSSFPVKLLERGLPPRAGTSAVRPPVAEGDARRLLTQQVCFRRRRGWRRAAAPMGRFRSWRAASPGSQPSAGRAGRPGGRAAGFSCLQRFRDEELDALLGPVQGGPPDGGVVGRRSLRMPASSVVILLLELLSFSSAGKRAPNERGQLSPPVPSGRRLVPAPRETKRRGRAAGRVPSLFRVRPRSPAGRLGETENGEKFSAHSFGISLLSDGNDPFRRLPPRKTKPSR